ncbi:MAG TPA: SIR2 family protein [Candidatus Hydrogenedens sp.]|nr:SIR2 family protein [Candidatus Hydrogenedens sp.]
MPVNIYFYKMHGSINWKRNQDGFLSFSDEVNQITEPDLIFGTNYKLQYIDPYLFYAYEFRKYSLESVLIITIGYSFSDDHINGIIGQAIRSQTTKKLLVNLYEENNKDEEKIKNVIAKKIKSKPEQIFLKNQKASEFLKGLLNEEALVNFFDQDTEFD